MITSLVTALVVGAAASRVTRPRPRRATPGPEVRPHRGFQVLRSRRTPILIVLAVLAALVLGPLLVCAVITAVIALPRLHALLAKKRRGLAVEAALPDAIEMLVLVIHAGMTPHQAILLLELRAPLPIRPAFAEVRHRTTRGASLADALSALPELVGPGALLIADALAMAERYGTPISTALEQLSSDVRERRRRATEGEARKLPIRMSFPLVACTLPSFVLLAIVPAVLAALESLEATGF